MSNATRKTFIDPAQEKIKKMANIPSPETRRDVQVIIVMINRLKSWLPEISFVTQGMRRLTSNRAPFRWTNYLEAELNKVREAIRHSVSLNPINTTKQLFLHTDAAKLKGLGLFLTQPISDNPED